MRQREAEFVYAGEKSAKKDQLGAVWLVYQNFEVEEKDGEVYVYASEGDLGHGRMYRPLLDQPDLFLRFASLAHKGTVTRDEAVQTMLEWVTTYGVLGVEYIDEWAGSGDHVYRGASRESLRNFTQAVRDAARCLRLYEAATAPNGPDGEALQRNGAFGNTVEEMKEDALVLANELVGRQVCRECFPVLYRQYRKESGQTLGFFQGWGCRSLLGAMYLQMMWLMTEASNVRRCKGPGCFRIITFGPPEQVPADPGLKKNARGKYRTRRDKEFCSRNCKEKWRYHHVIKPRRQKSSPS